MTTYTRTYLWNVYTKVHAGDKNIEYFHSQVDADTAGHACDWVCRSAWISRHQLIAYLAENEPEQIPGQARKVTVEQK